ncbi:MAG: MFS transporter [Ilumatobacteraceae bacterium]
MSTRFEELRAPLASRPFRALMAAQIASQLGDWAARLALALLVLERTGSPWLTSVTIAVTLLPWVGIGQLLASLGDRYGRRRTMIVCDSGRALIFGVLALVHLPIPIVLLLAFIAGCLDPPFEAARSATIPSLVPADDYPDAIAVSTALNQTALLLGYALGGGLVGLVGAQGALGVNSATFVLSSLLLLRIPADRGQPGSKLIRIAPAFRVIRVDPVIAHALLSFCAIAFFAMAAEGLVAPFTTDVVGLSKIEVGFVAAMVTVGTILGTFVLRVRGDDLRLLRLTGLLGVIGGVGAMITFSLSESRPVAYIGYFWIGVAFLASLTANAAAGRRIPAGVRASTFAILQAAVIGSHALGALAGGAVAEAWDIRSALLLASGFTAIAGVGGLLTVPRSAAPAAPDSAEDRATSER